MTEARELLEWVAAHRPWVDPDEARSMSELRYRCERIDLLALELPTELVQQISSSFRVTHEG